MSYNLTQSVHLMDKKKQFQNTIIIYKYIESLVKNMLKDQNIMHKMVSTWPKILNLIKHFEKKQQFKGHRTFQAFMSMRQAIFQN